MFKISSYGQQKIKDREGLRLTRYTDPAGVATIGYGHTKTASHYTNITKDQAESLFLFDVKMVERYLNNWAAQNDIPFLWQPQIDALGSLVFNLGYIPEKITSRIKTLNGSAVGATMQKYIYAGQKQLPGLVLRRKSEAGQFNKIKLAAGFAFAALLLHLYTPNR